MLQQLHKNLQSKNNKKLIKKYKTGEYSDNSKRLEEVHGQRTALIGMVKQI